MNTTVHKLCAYCGLAFLVLMGIGFAGLAHFVPLPSPHDSATEVAKMYRDRPTQIRFGLIISMAASALLMPFSVAMFRQMKRCEGPKPALAYIQLGLGAILVLEFIYLIFFWQTATFRADRSPEVIQALNDMGWIPFVGLSSTLIMQTFVFGVAMLLDRRAVPVFPRWLGFYNIWAALMFTPGSFNVFFKTGPLAWNGLVGIYIPGAVFLTWLVLNTVYLLRAIDGEAAEDAALPAAPDLAAMAAEIARLRRDLDRLPAGAA
jgi:hypothetical protein